jgi:hypothetical protein
VDGDFHGAIAARSHRWLLAAVALSGVLVLGRGVAVEPAPLDHRLRGDTLVTSAVSDLATPPPDERRCADLPLPMSWDVRRALGIDVTEHVVGLCALLVWRPWRPHVTTKWSPLADPTTGLHDGEGDGAHVALVAAVDGGYREVWVSSPLPQPPIDLLVLDLDGDGGHELILLEGEYRSGRTGAVRAISVWRWNGFGFTLVARAAVTAGPMLSACDCDGDVCSVAR